MVNLVTLRCRQRSHLLRRQIQYLHQHILKFGQDCSTLIDPRPIDNKGIRTLADGSSDWVPAGAGVVAATGAGAGTGGVGTGAGAGTGGL